MSDRTGYHLAVFATLLAFCVVVLGAYTRLTDAGLGCPDWPGCYGKWIVTSELEGNHQSLNAAKAWTEMTHRYLAGLLGLAILALAILAVRNRHDKKQPLILPLTLLILVIFQALLGMWTVTLKLFPLVVMAHLLGGLTTLSLVLWLTLSLKPNQNIPWQIDKIAHLQKLAFFGLIILGIQLFLGGWTSANYAALVCVDFPFCQGASFSRFDFWQAFDLTAAGVTGSLGEPLDYSARVAIHLVHRIGALITTLVLGWLAFQTFVRAQSLAIRSLSLALATLLIVQILLGITTVLYMLPLPVALAHNAVAALLLLALVSLNYYLHISLQHKKTNPNRNKLLIRDLLELCKPKVVAVMLITSLVGMYLAATESLSWTILSLAILGIGLSGSSAAVINHVLDRHIDAKMIRTQQRPLVHGRITTTQALVFSLFLAIMGLGLLYFFINKLTALLSLVTILGYAVFYTIFLKRRTPQNIVIGGLAGAMPPLLGWTAVSGEITAHALLLVLIIFTWTPPHFWALSIYRCQDYANAKIPMLPVTHGIQVTKLYIVLYAFLLMAVSLLPFVTQLSGYLYLISALMLGFVFLKQTFVLYKSKKEDTALKTFHFSIVYLLLLFIALLTDHQIQIVNGSISC